MFGKNTSAEKTGEDFNRVSYKNIYETFFIFNQSRHLCKIREGKFRKQGHGADRADVYDKTFTFVNRLLYQRYECNQNQIRRKKPPFSVVISLNSQKIQKQIVIIFRYPLNVKSNAKRNKYHKDAPERIVHSAGSFYYYSFEVCACAGNIRAVATEKNKDCNADFADYRKSIRRRNARKLKQCLKSSKKITNFYKSYHLVYRQKIWFLNTCRKNKAIGEHY